MTPIEQAIAALEQTQLDHVQGDITKALAILRSIPGPATEEEIRSIWERKHLYSVMTSLEFCTGFREGEARLLGRREG